MVRRSRLNEYSTDRLKGATKSAFVKQMTTAGGIEGKEEQRGSDSLTRSLTALLFLEASKLFVLHRRYVRSLLLWSKGRSRR